jgi:dTDP-3-amino-2,3,6-trideoxy-4-keto-D-glucose/dTDP-3-amino-3,4,6-trideoxy-alpha-D-glucose/dTDP-2,6-dideoxy-D-kanosamine transaminase
VIVININEPAREYEALSSEIEAAVLETLRSGRWLFGKATEAFVRRFSESVGVEHVIPVANGTDALEIGLRAVGVGLGDEVVTAANAGGYTSIACRIIGAVPVYADIVLPGMTIDPEDVSALLSPKVKAVVVTHLYGNLGDVDGMRRVLAAAGREDVAIVEDCAQSHGVGDPGRRGGSLGDLATFSFYPSKNLGALGDAGAVVTGREDLARQVRLLAQYGWESRYKSVVSSGRNSRIDEVQAAILTIKLGHLDAITASRRAVLSRYRAALPPSYRLCALEGAASVGHLAVILCPDRAAAAEHLKHHGVQTDIHYPTLDCDQPAWRDLPMRTGDLARSRDAVERILTLPCYPHLSESDLTVVCDALASLPSTS